ncbi:DUF2142 domain-containing protein [Thomasclavelia sp.]
MKEIINRICENKKYKMMCIIIISIILTILVVELYIYPKMQNDVLFDKNPILKDRWVALEQDQIIDNTYEFVSDDSKLSSLVVTVQNVDIKNYGNVIVIVEDSEGNLIGQLEDKIEPNIPSKELKIEINEKNLQERIKIKLKNIGDNENIKTRITDSEDIEDAHLAYKIYSTMPDFVLYFVIIILIFINLIFIIGVYFIFIKKLSYEKIFIGIIFLTGLCYTLIFTPGTIPDESTHIRNTLGYSSIILSKGTNEDIVIRECENFIGDTQPSIKTLNSYRKLIVENNRSAKYVKTGEVLSSDFTIISYLPGIIAVTISRLLSFGGILTIYLARFTNFIVYAFASYYSIKKIPIAKIAFFALALLPMVIHQTISLSYDTIILSSAWLVIGYGFSFVYGKENISKKDIIVYVLASCILITQKTGIYFLLNLIPLLIGRNRIKDKKERIMLKLILTFPWIITLVGFPILTKSSQASRTVSQANIIGWADKEGYNIPYFLANKKESVLLFIRTIVKKCDHYIFTTLGQQLGSLNLLLSKNLFIGWLMALFAGCFKTKDDQEDVPISHKIIYVLSFCAVCGASMLAMAFAFTPVGWPTIEGVQGRYFLPVLMLLILVIRNKRIILDSRLQNTLILLIVFFEIVTIINILGALLMV